MPSLPSVELLAHHQDLVGLVSQWFIGEWPAWYGVDGPGDAVKDVTAFAVSESNLPVGFVVLNEGTPIGAGALKRESIESHKHLSPWAAAGFVLPEYRGRGVGRALLRTMVAHAHDIGFEHVYCGTGTAGSLLRRCGWLSLEVVQLAGKPLTIFRSAAQPNAQGGHAAAFGVAGSPSRGS